MYILSGADLNLYHLEKKPSLAYNVAPETLIMSLLHHEHEAPLSTSPALPISPEFMATAMLGETAVEADSTREPTPDLEITRLDFGTVAISRGKWHQSKDKAAFKTELRDIFITALCEKKQISVEEAAAILDTTPQWEKFLQDMDLRVEGSGFTVAHHGNPEIDPFSQEFQAQLTARTVALIEDAVSTKGWVGEPIDSLYIASMTLLDPGCHTVVTHLAARNIHIKKLRIYRMACASGMMGVVDAHQRAAVGEHVTKAEPRVVVAAIEDISGTCMDIRPDLEDLASPSNISKFTTYWVFGAAGIAMAFDARDSATVLAPPSVRVFLNADEPVMSKPRLYQDQPPAERLAQTTEPPWYQPTQGVFDTNSLKAYPDGVVTDIVDSKHVILNGDAAFKQFVSFVPLVALEQLFTAALAGHTPEVTVCHQANKTIVAALEKKTRVLYGYLTSLSSEELTELSSILDEAILGETKDQRKEILGKLYDRGKKMNIAVVPFKFLEKSEFLPMFKQVLELYKLVRAAVEKNRLPVEINIPTFEWVMDRVGINNVSGPTTLLAEAQLMQEGVIKDGTIVLEISYAVGTASVVAAITKQVHLSPQRIIPTYG